MMVFFRIASESPNIRKISLMLEQTGLPCVTKFVAPGENGLPDPEFARISPNGTAPAMVDVDTGATLFESGAILYYLAEKSGRLLPSRASARADAIKWLMFEAANVCPTMIELHHYLLNDSGQYPQEIFLRYRRRLTHYCAMLDRQLEDREYLAGDLSIADVALYPWTAALPDMAEIDLKAYPHLSRWASLLDERLAGPVAVARS